MKSRDFCYWLQGFFELAAGPPNGSLSAHQTQIIQRHLALVFKHDIDPQAYVEMKANPQAWTDETLKITPEEYKKILDDLHQGAKSNNPQTQITHNQPICQSESDIYRC